MKLMTLIIIASVSISSFAADTTRILWFGHSLLASGGVNRSTEFSKWAAQTKRPLIQKMQNAGCGYSYEIMQSWKETCNPDTIRKGGWNFVAYNVLYKTYLATDSFYKYQKAYNNIIDSIGAKAIIYDDWHQPSTPFAIQVCKTEGAYLSPVQTAYLWVSSRYPDIHYKVDWAHAAEPLGYLAGATTWATIFCERPFGFDTVYAKLNRETAHLMQQVAWNTIADTAYRKYTPWSPMPRFVKAIDFSASADTIEQYRTRQLYIKTTFDNDSIDASSKWAIFRSLDPSLAVVSYSGIVTAINLGTARIEAIRESKIDTLLLNIKNTTLTLDSVRITPKIFVSYLENGFQFTSTGFFRDSNAKLLQNVTASINWYSSDPSIFTIAGGKIQRTSGRGGNMWVAVELSGKVDTVRFTMPPQLQFLARINFQPDSTILNPVWTPEWGNNYSDARGMGWEQMKLHNGIPYADKQWDANAINYLGANFLTRSYFSPKSPTSNSDTTGVFHIKCIDGDYILKYALGHGEWNSAGSQISTVVFNNDTLARDSAYAKKPATIYKDTIRVFGMDGIRLKIKGPINYLVVCTKEGVDIDSIALDTPPFCIKSGSSSIENLSVNINSSPEIIIYPNPFNPTTAIRVTSAESSKGELKIFNSQGKLVSTLKTKNGLYVWNAEGLSTGVYIARYSAGQTTIQKQLLFLK
ncbi:MAG: T9SS type A sorting domain-containing protein [Fibrobacteres bacterium]|nr:T9SS type A sorting domain-containing protein [Fibrobacterota bacterium]